MVTRLRIGLGYDRHRVASGGPLRLGGVTIPWDHHLVGHSDADVLLHAVTDALLGAVGLADIGELFPDTDASNAGIDSAVMLREARQRVAAAGYQMVNLDCVVLAQRPRLLPHRAALRESLARLLDCRPEAVFVKAKTGEGVGPIGRGEAIAAHCVVLLEPADAQGS